MTRPLAIRPAHVDDAAALTGLAVRSKAHWGYSPEFMDACRAELTWTAEELADAERGFLVFVAERDGTPVGFYALEPLAGEGIELDSMFVEPAHIGTGVGRALLDHALHQSRQLRRRTMVIRSDPNAAAFYEAAGAVKVGEAASESLAPRKLPVLELAVPAP